MYDVHSKFDIEQHKATFINYLEVVIYPDGTVEYAVPSHQEKLISICCKLLKVTRDELCKMVPEEYYFNLIVWLCNMSGCASVWNEHIVEPENLTHAQCMTMVKLIDEGLYKGEF